MKTEIYYFTGSGNSLKIAKDLFEMIDDSMLIRINKQLIDTGHITVSGKTGIVFPVYVSGLPVIVEKFLNILDITENTYLFAIANFGGSADSSLLQMDDLLRIKGKSLSAAFEILMPDNTQIIFPPGSKDEQVECIRSQKEKMPEIAEIINKGVKYTEKIDILRKNPNKSQRPHEFKPSEMGKNLSSDEKCNSCGICEKVCPVDNIALSEGKPKWMDHCELCLACMQWCPKEAIQFGEKTKEWGRYHNPEIGIHEMYNIKQNIF